MITLLEFLLKKHIDIDSDFIDLELPSKTLWASTNIGAKLSTENGDYFAWGEIYPKDEFTSDNYILDINDYTKEAELLPKDDAAVKILKDGWHIPSVKQFDELVENTTLNFTEMGVTLTSKNNGNILFIPISGIKGKGMMLQENVPCLWCNSCTLLSDHRANYYSFEEYSCHSLTTWKRMGMNIRAIKDKK